MFSILIYLIVHNLFFPFNPVNKTLNLPLLFTQIYWLSTDSVPGTVLFVGDIEHRTEEQPSCPLEVYYLVEEKKKSTGNSYSRWYILWARQAFRVLNRWHLDPLLSGHGRAKTKNTSMKEAHLLLFLRGVIEGSGQYFQTDYKTDIQI